MDVRLRASEDYFSATSPCERVSGIELHERLARVFVERMLKPNPNEVMLVAAAYERFAMKTEKKMREVVTGTCEVAHVSPQDLPTDGPGSVVNLVLGFEEALKLNLALDEAVRGATATIEAPASASSLECDLSCISANDASTLRKANCRPE